MALFNRKKKTDSVGMPPELQDYYQAENRERTWMAWVLGLATLVVTILLALALFFGGRWVYRKVRNEPAVTTTQTENKADQATVSTNSPTDTDSNNNDTATTPPSTPAPAPSPSSTPAPTTGTSSTSTSTPGNAGKVTSTALPDTGPSDTLAIFAAVTVLAYAAHRRLVNR